MRLRLRDYPRFPSFRAAQVTQSTKLKIGSSAIPSLHANRTNIRKPWEQTPKITTVGQTGSSSKPKLVTSEHCRPQSENNQTMASTLIRLHDFPMSDSDHSFNYQPCCPCGQTENVSDSGITHGPSRQSWLPMPSIAHNLDEQRVTKPNKAQGKHLLYRETSEDDPNPAFCKH